LQVIFKKTTSYTDLYGGQNNKKLFCTQRTAGGIKVFKYKFTKGKVYTSLCASLFLALSIPIVSRAGSETSPTIDKSQLFIEILNYTMPVIKNNNVSEDDLAEMDFSLKEKLLEFIGLDIKNPLSIVSREFNLIKNSTPELSDTETSTPFTINPFKLSESYIIKNTNNEVAIPNINSGEIHNEKLKKALNPSKPEVLIYHTHITESYSSDGNYNKDLTKNMAAVGEVLTKELQDYYGIAVVHDTTYHDNVFNESYARSGNTLDKYLDKYKDFKLIIDLHRDGGPEKDLVTANINNASLAKYEFVIGAGNKTKDKNIAVSKKLVSISQTYFPGLVRPGNTGTTEDFGLYIHRTGTKFNQHKSPNAVLIELGSETNTIDEAKTTAIYLARVIAEYINAK
jgi:stage II sporulation protein P